MTKKIRDELQELLSASAANDQEAFRMLYDVTHKKIHFFVCRIIKDTQMAEDVVMETYTAVWKGAKTFQGRSKVQTWMFGIARNLAMNTLKKKRPEHTIDDFPQLATEGGVDIAGLDRKAMIAKALLAISAKHREVLDLVFFQGFNYGEIADVLNTSENTIKTRVFYAKKALHQVLEKMGVNRDDL
jgi:RNA polymerase sigma-70 factor, ECF subfamily